MLASDFLTFFGSGTQFPGGKTRFATSADTRESSPPYLLKNKMSLKNFQMIWQPY